MGQWEDCQGPAQSSSQCSIPEGTGRGQRSGTDLPGPPGQDPATTHNSEDEYFLHWQNYTYTHIQKNIFCSYALPQFLLKRRLQSWFWRWATPSFHHKWAIFTHQLPHQPWISAQIISFTSRRLQLITPLLQPVSYSLKNTQSLSSVGLWIFPHRRKYLILHQSPNGVDLQKCVQNVLSFRHFQLFTSIHLWTAHCSLALWHNSPHRCLQIFLPVLRLQVRNGFSSLAWRNSRSFYFQFHLIPLADVWINNIPSFYEHNPQIRRALLFLDESNTKQSEKKHKIQ